MFECICQDFDGDGQWWHMNQIFENYAEPDDENCPVCCECGEKIEYEAEMDVACCCSEGDVKTFYTCKTCNTIRDDMFACGFIYGQMYEAIANVWCDEDPESVEFLIN
jgi:hypothetical protein